MVKAPTAGFSSIAAPGDGRAPKAGLQLLFLLFPARKIANFQVPEPDLFPMLLK